MVTKVAGRGRRKTFDVDHATSRFYKRFQQERAIFINCMYGISLQADREWYASLLLNRMMFVYFIQKKGFLDGNSNYLADKLRQVQEKCGKDSFLRFYHHLLLRLFQEALPAQKQVSLLDVLLGAVPFLNDGLLEIHAFERETTGIQIADEAFERIFTFFDSYQWRIDEIHDAHEINPDVIGSLFEQYINQKQMGAYYTRADISAYISKNAIIPHIFRVTAQKYSAAFERDGAVWQLLRAWPERYISNVVRTEEYLPTETEREYRERNTRYRAIRDMLTSGKCHTINQLISYNLDSYRFTLDIIKGCKSSELLRAFYESIKAITVLDPTCGSGAFLFAALHILEPLYAACLDRMGEIVINNDEEIEVGRADLEFFRGVLEQVGAYSNQSYFILKNITINNIYGVDIMREAVEICKLRLFLKLIAQLKRVEEIESLPDIDFNIRSGNTLVGFAHYDEISKVAPDEMEGIEDEARQVEQELADWHKLQIQRERLPKEIRQRKIHVQAAQKQLNNRLNHYLAAQYGKGREIIADQDVYEKAFAQWYAGHQPFHWCVDFPCIMARGGFDVIIGNPPYLEYSKVRRDYTVRGYQTESCGNLYAAVIERSLTLCRNEHSYLGLIVPLSMCSSERFEQLRRTITLQTAELWLANFEIFPCRLFDGAFQRLSILLAQHGNGQPCAMHVTRIQRWYAAERAHLIDIIAYTPVRHVMKADVFPKLASPLQETILRKLLDRARALGRRAPVSIETALHPGKTEHFVYYQEATNYWTKALCHIPYYKKDGRVMEPAHGRFLYFGDQQSAYTVMALMNSSLFYVWFAMFSDGFHLSHALVKGFPVGEDIYAVKALAKLAVRLEGDIKAHARMSTRNTKATTKKKGHLIELEEYRMGYSKSLLDEIDCALARYYGFSEEELDFIVNYDSKYRMK